MVSRQIDDPIGFLSELGFLHDARIARLYVDVSKQTLLLALEDLYANVEGLTEYPGRTPAELIFSGVADVAIDIAPQDDILISAAQAAKAGDGFGLVIHLRNGYGKTSGGKTSIRAHFRALLVNERT